MKLRKGTLIIIAGATGIIFYLISIALDDGHVLSGVGSLKNGYFDNTLKDGEKPGSLKSNSPSVSSSKTSWQEVYPHGIYRRDQELRGLVFTDKTEMGDKSGEFSANVTLSVVKSLSKPVIEHVKEIFNDEHGENIYFATIPAIVRRGKNIEAVQRIWLAQYEKMKNHYRNNGISLNKMFNEWENSWQENYFYRMTLDENYNMQQPGELMGIPTTTNIRFTYKSDGPMDPRLVQVGENTYLVFHTWLVDKHSKDEIAGRVHIYDMHRHTKKKLWPHIQLQRTEINWIPLDLNGELYFTYSVDPLRVMKCQVDDGDCRFVHEQDGSKEATFLYTNDHLRGGTPWVKYKYPYYISICHNVATTYRPLQDFAIYNVNLVVIDVESWRVVYVSRNILANTKWLSSEYVIRNHTIAAPFWYPTGLILQTDNILDISCHLNDASGHILRLTGFKPIINEAIRKDSLNVYKKGPRTRVVQQYVLESTKEMYKNKWTFLGDIINHTVEGVDIKT